MHYHMSSFNEIVGLGYLKQSPVDFVKCDTLTLVYIVNLVECTSMKQITICRLQLHEAAGDACVPERRPRRLE